MEASMSVLVAAVAGYVLCVFVPVPVMSGYVYRGWASLIDKIKSSQSTSV